VQNLSVRAPASLGGQPYWVLGSLTGTSPGIPLGPVTLPLTFDAYTAFTVTHPGRGLLSGQLGVLSPSGTADLTLFIPSLPVLAGMTFHHAYVVFGAGLVPAYASRAVPLAIYP
jgi:hypothetical protein